MILPAAEWTPDQPSLSNPGVNTALNVIPYTEGSYGPFNSLAPYSAPLSGTALGAISVEDSAGAVSVFAGTATNLYRMPGVSTVWNDVSGGAYATPAGEYWRFCQFKNDIIATNFSAPVQSYILGTSATFSALSAGAPTARYCAIIKSFLFLANTNDPVGGLAPFRTWWSAENDPTSFPAPGSAQAQQFMSDYNDLAGAQGAITGLVGNLGSADGALFFERAIYRIIFTGPPDIFDFLPAEGVRGCRAPNSIVQMGALVYYRGEDDFYVFDGATSQGIAFGKVNKWFTANVNPVYPLELIGAADVANQTIVWIFPSLASTNGAPDSVLIYHWRLQRFSYAQLPAQWLFRFIAPSGQVQLAAIDPYGRVALFTGPALAAQVSTTELQPTPGKRSWINDTRPLVSGAQNPTVSIGSRNRLADDPVFGPDVALDEWGNCPQLVDGRYIQALVKIPAGATWTHAEGVDVDAMPAGDR